MTKPIVRILAGGPKKEGPLSQLYKTVIPTYRLDLIGQIQQERIKYVIKWNFDLKGQTLYVPRECILEFDGGSIKNGRINWNNTQVFNLYDKEIFENITESGTRTTFGGGV